MKTPSLPIVRAPNAADSFINANASTAKRGTFTIAETIRVAVRVLGRTRSAGTATGAGSSNGAGGVRGI